MKIGQKAPDFELADRSGKTFSLEDFSGDFLVVYFYPKDDTPGCTIQAQEFTKSLPKFRKLKAEVVGISGGDDRSKERFCKKFGLKVRLLSDSDFKVARRWGSFGKKKFMGREYEGIFRNTYLLDQDRKVRKIFEGVKPDEHIPEVLEAIGSISAAKAEKPARSAKGALKASAPQKKPGRPARKRG